MALLRLLVLTALIGCGLTEQRNYRGEPIPDDVPWCKDTEGFQVDVYQSKYKCFQPDGGEPNDVGDLKSTCSCEEKQTCKYTQASHVAPAPPPASGNHSQANDTSAPVHASISLKEAKSFDYMCENDEVSAEEEQDRLNLGGNANSNSNGGD